MEINQNVFNPGGSSDLPMCGGVGPVSDGGLENTVPCLHCGLAFKKQGITAHMKACARRRAANTASGVSVAPIAPTSTAQVLGHCQVADRVQCDKCDRSFKTRAGLGVHTNAAHPREYHLANLPPPLVKPRWEAEELVLMAREELRLQTQGFGKGFWRGMFEAPSKVDQRSPKAKCCPLMELLEPVLPAEYAAMLKTTKNGSPGIDGFDRAFVRSIEIDDGRSHFNLWLVAGRPPSPFKEGITLPHTEVGRCA
jgi:hypothetical protein